MVDEKSPLIETAIANGSCLTVDEIGQLRSLLQKSRDDDDNSVASDDSNYPEFAETTHAWFVFGNRHCLDSLIGSMIIIFQIYVYTLFAEEALEDHWRHTVSVSISYDQCVDSDEIVDMKSSMVCIADDASTLDQFAAFFMFGIFITSDLIQSGRAVKLACSRGILPFLRAILALIEVVSALVSATISISQQLKVGEAAGAIEVGVGLLFIRELSSRAYLGLRYGGKKRYLEFIVILILTVLFGFYAHPLLVEIFDGWHPNAPTSEVDSFDVDVVQSDNK